MSSPVSFVVLFRLFVCAASLRRYPQAPWVCCYCAVDWRAVANRLGRTFYVFVLNRERGRLCCFRVSRRLRVVARLCRSSPPSRRQHTRLHMQRFRHCSYDFGSTVVFFLHVFAVHDFLLDWRAVANRLGRTFYVFVLNRERGRLCCFRVSRRLRVVARLCRSSPPSRRQHTRLHMQRFRHCSYDFGSTVVFFLHVFAVHDFLLAHYNNPRRFVGACLRHIVVAQQSLIVLYCLLLYRFCREGSSYPRRDRVS